MVAGAEGRGIDSLLSEEILAEIKRILGCEGVRRVYEEAEASREEMVTAIVRVGKLIDVATELNIVCEDPSDNKFIGCAVDGNANYNVSGDSHLLRIGQHEGVKGLTANESLEATRR